MMTWAVTHLEPGLPGGALLAERREVHHDVGDYDRQEKVQHAEPEVSCVHLHSKEDYTLRTVRKLAISV